jgi:uncharacterized protein (DUF1697 family)
MTHVALLRAVNLPGHNKVGTSELKVMLAGLGFTDAQTLLASGNIVFSGGSSTTAALEQMLERAAARQLGLETDVIVRTAKEWQAIIDANPFPREAKDDPSHLLAVITKDDVSAASASAMQKAIAGPELVRAKGRCAYIVYPDGIGRSKVTGAFIDKKLGTSGTGRNWNTVLKLGQLVAGRR